MIDGKSNATIEDYVKLQRERSNLLLAAEAEVRMRDPKEAVRRESVLKEVAIQVQGRNV